MLVRGREGVTDQRRTRQGNEFRDNRGRVGVGIAKAEEAERSYSTRL